jgi:hypothetical protein
MRSTHNILFQYMRMQRNTRKTSLRLLFAFLGIVRPTSSYSVRGQNQETTKVVAYPESSQHGCNILVESKDYMKTKDPFDPTQQINKNKTIVVSKIGTTKKT